MGEKSKIAWCDDTANPWIGCEKVSPGCKNCYAEAHVEGRMSAQQKVQLDFKVRRPTKGAIKNLMAWNNKPWVCKCGAFEQGTMVGTVNGRACCGRCLTPRHRRRVFVGSMMDWLDDKVPAELLFELIKTIHRTPELNYLLLTKRPENFAARLKAAAAQCTVDPLDITDRIYAWVEGSRIYYNVWFGVTVENQAMADKRIPLLLDIPAKVRFVSYEPALEAVDFKFPSGTSVKNQKLPDDFDKWSPAMRDDWFKSTARAIHIARCSIGIHWIIVGGESGPQARPFNVQWARSTVEQCRAAGVACFVKQMGSNPVMLEPFGEDREVSECQLKLKAKKGDDPAEWPEDLRVQQWPEVVR